MIDFRKINAQSCAVYINFPFCKQACSYCHYIANLQFGFSEIPNGYYKQVYRNLEEILKQMGGVTLQSIYFGGGTPSLLNDDQIFSLRQLFEKNNIKSKEVSIELHPGIINFDYGNNDFFTRYSIGVQTINNQDLGTYNRDLYSEDMLKTLISNIRNSSVHRDLNLDFIFLDQIRNENIEFCNEIGPETVTFYPNTKGRGKDRLRKVYESLDKLSQRMAGYHGLGKSKFIFIKDGCSVSLYSKLLCEDFGDVIGVGNNSVSYLADESYLCVYENEKILYQLRQNRGNRKLISIITSLPTGVKKIDVINAIPDIYSMHYLRTVDGDYDVKDKHISVSNNDLIYLPDTEYIRFYKYLKEHFTQVYIDAYLGTIGFGDCNYESVSQIYNEEFIVANNEKIEIKPKKITPNLHILVEGIDGSGKDTFVQYLATALKKRYMYTETSRISILGQPSSKGVNGVDAKKFIEDLKYSGDEENVKNLLESNRKDCELKMLNIPGVKIVVRGILTDKATFIKEFGHDCNLGEGTVISKWDKLIVIDIDPKEADRRIEKRGIPRTWRENLNYLKYFRNYYLNYESKLFADKLVIYNDDLRKLERAAEKLADEIYYGQ